MTFGEYGMFTCKESIRWKAAQPWEQYCFAVAFLRVVVEFTEHDTQLHAIYLQRDMNKSNR